MDVPPLEVRLYATAGPGTFAWTSTPGAQSSVVYRGLVSSLTDTDGDGLADSGYGDCAAVLNASGAELVYTDTGPNPASGTAVVLVVAPVTLHGEVSLGTSSSGLRRYPSLACP